EDGIRDGHVTGVQTCALPISSRMPAGAQPDRWAASSQAKLAASAMPAFMPYPAIGTHRWAASPQMNTRPSRNLSATSRRPIQSRSEERRVGKEGELQSWYGGM